MRHGAADLLQAQVEPPTRRRPVGARAPRRACGATLEREAFRRRLEVTPPISSPGSGRPARSVADNEFDVALAAADVAWRLGSDGTGAAIQYRAQCPACAQDAGRRGFRAADLAERERCASSAADAPPASGNVRAHGARLLRADIWAAMESMRAELGAVGMSEPRPASTSCPLLEELKRAFAENGWPYSEVRGAPVLLADLSGPAGRWGFYAQAVEEKDSVLLYSICPQRVPETRRREVSEFLTRANYRPGRRQLRARFRRRRGSVQDRPSPTGRRARRADPQAARACERGRHGDLSAERLRS